MRVRICSLAVWENLTFSGWCNVKILLDTNIVINREASTPINRDIGRLFRWLDNLGYRKCIHQVTLDEIHRLKDKRTLESFTVKLENYNLLPISARLDPTLLEVSKKFDSTANDANDTTLLNEVYADRVDILLTEDRKIHRKAQALRIDTRVFTIDSFLEKLTVENPTLVDYKVPSVRKEYFGNVNLDDEFFDSFKEDYLGFDAWFRKKAYETAYISQSGEKTVAFLYLKGEGPSETYSDIDPPFEPKRRLKIGTLKVQLNGYRLGERFLKICFDNALRLKVDEIYVTIFDKRVEQKRLAYLLEDFGFRSYGRKTSSSGEESVYVRDFSRRALPNTPRETYPFISLGSRKFIVPIYPQYHTSLFPDSILKTESPIDFLELEPHRNAISKVYISRSIKRDLRPGDVIVFYRTGGFYEGVVSTLGIVESVITNIKSFDDFRRLCKKRSVFTDQELEEQWEYNKNNRPFIVNFLYAYSFPKRPNLKQLIDLGVINNTASVPRGFEQISDSAFLKIIKESQSDESLIVH